MVGHLIDALLLLFSVHIDLEAGGENKRENLTFTSKPHRTNLSAFLAK